MGYKSIRDGALGGIAGGAAFGILLGLNGTFPLIGRLVGSPDVSGGLFVHMAISVFVGGVFGWLLRGRVHSGFAGIAYGLMYGFSWWYLGPMTLLPALLGMGLSAEWNAAATGGDLLSLTGHLVYGLILGFTYTRLQLGSSPGLLSETPTPTCSDS